MNIEPAVTVVITKAKAKPRVPVRHLEVGTARLGLLGKGSVSAVDIKQIAQGPRRLVDHADIQIGISIVVDITPPGTVARRNQIDARKLADIFECAVAAITKKDVRFTVAGNEQVAPTIVVVIRDRRSPRHHLGRKFHPSCRRRPLDVADPSVVRHVDEGFFRRGGRTAHTERSERKHDGDARRERLQL